MAQLHQMQLSYVPTEDRLLFRVNTSARQEFRFWMTRRYVGLLWKAVMDLLRKRETQRETQREPKGNEPKPPRDPLAKKAAIAVEHQKQVANANFQSAYQESTYLPLGENPTLLFKVQVKVIPQRKQVLLCMHPKEGEGIEFGLDDKMLHSLLKLLNDSTTKANWKLGLDFDDAESMLPDPGLN